jgi:hypothetical protein
MLCLWHFWVGCNKSAGGWSDSKQGVTMVEFIACLLALVILVHEARETAETIQQ